VPISSTGSRIPRSPQFLSRVRGMGGTMAFGSKLARRVVPFLEGPGGGPLSDGDLDGHPGVEPLAPPLPPPPPQPGPEFAARLAQAVADLRQQAQRLGEQAEADVVEMAVIIARRILEAELSTGTEPLFSLVRSAIRRLGESRRITVRLCPSDAAAVQAAGDGSPVAGLAIAKVDVMADSTLGPGDCIVDGEHGTVDGQLSSRLDEVRRIVTSALAEPQETP
jgi:Flagellar assembly protein FliH